MSRVLNNSAVIFIIVCFQLILISSEINIGKSAANGWTTQPKETSDTIRLSGIVNVRKYVLHQCTDKCRDVLGEQSPAYVTHTEPLLKTNMSEIHCENDEWILNWDNEDLGKQHGDISCASRKYISSCTFDCTPCICATSNTNHSSHRWEAVNSFSLHPQESETNNNRVVTGLRLKLDKNNIIQLEIQEAKLLSNGTVDEDKVWKDIVDFNKLAKLYTGSDDFGRLEYGKDYVSFSYNIRTMFLDEIFVPDDYVVTGVRFVKIDSSEWHKGVKLQVKGTKYNSSFRLRRDSERWFDYTDRILQGPSYNWTRREINLDNCTDPTHANNNTEISDTNRFIRFRATDMRRNSEKHIIPFFSKTPAEIRGKLPLRGIGLSYKGQEGYGGYVTLKVFQHESLIYTPDGHLKTNSATRYYCQIIAIAILPLWIFY